MIFQSSYVLHMFFCKKVCYVKEEKILSVETNFMKIGSNAIYICSNKKKFQLLYNIKLVNRVRNYNLNIKFNIFEEQWNINLSHLILIDRS